MIGENGRELLNRGPIEAAKHRQHCPPQKQIIQVHDLLVTGDESDLASAIVGQ